LHFRPRLTLQVDPHLVLSLHASSTFAWVIGPPPNYALCSSTFFFSCRCVNFCEARTADNVQQASQGQDLFKAHYICNGLTTTIKLVRDQTIHGLHSGLSLTSTAVRARPLPDTGRSIRAGAKLNKDTANYEYCAVALSFELRRLRLRIKFRSYLNYSAVLDCTLKASTSMVNQSFALSYSYLAELYPKDPDIASYSAPV